MYSSVSLAFYEFFSLSSLPEIFLRDISPLSLQNSSSPPLKSLIEIINLLAIVPFPYYLWLSFKC